MKGKARAVFNNAMQAHCIVTAESRHQMRFVYTAALCHRSAAQGRAIAALIPSFFNPSAPLQVK
jgi:hypothetical protein